MSNTLAISSATAAFSRRIHGAAVAAVGNAKVRRGVPTAKLADDGKPVVNLHLYRVEPNAFNANAHLPSRGRAGPDRAPAQLALNLHYVLSFYGNHEDFEPERMLGEVMLALEAEPVLAVRVIRAAVADAADLAGSDLEDAPQRLRVTRSLHSVDEFSKIWSIFYQVPYALSLVYEVAHVVIENDIAPPAPLPVSRAANWVAPMSALRLDRAGGPARAPAVWGGRAEIMGQGLGAPDLTLTIGGAITAIETQSADRMTVQLSAAALGGRVLKAGLHPLQAVRAPKAGQPAHLAPRSNTVAFALHPRMSAAPAVTALAGGATADGHMDISVDPPVGSDQAVRLLLDSRDPARPGQVVLPGRDPAAPGGADAAQLRFDFAGLARGAYLARLDVDGFVSPVDIDPASAEITGPEVVV